MPWITGMCWVLTLEFPLYKKNGKTAFIANPWRKMRKSISLLRHSLYSCKALFKPWLSLHLHRSGMHTLEKKCWGQYPCSFSCSACLYAWTSVAFHNFLWGAIATVSLSTSTSFWFPPPFQSDACEKWSVLSHILSACCVGNTSWQIWMMQQLLKYSTFSYVPQVLVKHCSNCESPCIWTGMRCAALKEANTPISLLFVLQYLLTDMTFCCISHILVRHFSSCESPSIHKTWVFTLWFISIFCCVVQPTVQCH